MNGASDDDIAMKVLIQAQDDALDRLRDYWLPRYLLHCNFSNDM